MVISSLAQPERPTGGYKFKGQLPFAIRSKASKTTEIHPEWDGAADKVTPDLESIEFFEVSGFKGDSRELQCQLMRKEVTTQNGSLLTFDLALANMWFKVTGHSEVAFKVFEAGGIVTGESGQVGNVEAKLPEGFPSPGKKYESKDALDKVTEKDAQPGDYFIKADSDEQTNTITYRLFIRIPVKKDSKDPEEVSFKIPVKKADGSTKELNTKWSASSK